LSGADLVEDKIPIDLPRHFIRRALLVREGVARRRHPDGFLSSIEFLTQNPSELISQSLSVTAVSILLFTESLRPSGIFLKKMQPRMNFKWQDVNRNRSRAQLIDEFSRLLRFVAALN
jgi:hypothetical protein